MSGNKVHAHCILKLENMQLCDDLDASEQYGRRKLIRVVESVKTQLIILP